MSLRTFPQIHAAAKTRRYLVYRSAESRFFLCVYAIPETDPSMQPGA